MPPISSEFFSDGSIRGSVLFNVNNMRLLYLFGTLIVWLLFLQFSIEHSSISASQEAQIIFHNNLDAWQEATSAFAKTFFDGGSIKDLRVHHQRTRQAFKKTEWLAAFLDESAIKKHINGAPLPTVEQHVAELRVIEPGGLQTLEELVFEDVLDTAYFAKTLSDLVNVTPVIIRDLKKRKLSQASLFNATRYGFIRIYTLGITGFDTPSSGNALSENAITLASIRDGLLPLLQTNENNTKAKKLHKEIVTKFNLGEDMLTTGDFDSFDRLTFLMEVIDPLYSLLLDLQVHLAIELPEDLSDREQAHNYRSKSLFSDDFLNDFFYAEQPREDSLFWRKQELGKELFYETSLSSSGNISCASCHNPAKAFTDGEAKSIGNNGEPISRNAPTLIGAVYAERYFADLREPTLSRQIRHVVQDEHEFGTDYLTILESLRQNEAYLAEFRAAYADVDSTYQLSVFSLSDALASYVRGLHSNTSQVDAFIAGEIKEIAPDVRLGFNLFMGKAACGTCHFAPTFAGLVPPFYMESETEVLGVPSEWPIQEDTELDNDFGRIASGRPLDGAPFYAFSFKTPTVRNVALTTPYMHNGSMKDLEGVVDFYNRGGGLGLGFDVPHQTLPFDSLSLTPIESSALVAFMEALTDERQFE